MVSTAVMNYLMEIAVISFIFPGVLLVIWKLRTRKSIRPAFTGAFTFLMFAKLLQVIPYSFFIGFTNPISKVIRTNEILYALYLGIVAALFEETGRYLAFRYFLPKYGENRETAVTYGIGHGGVECMLMYGFTNLQYYAAATVINTIPDATTALPKAMIDEVTGLTLSDCIMDGIGTLLFLVLQIGLSIFIFQAYRNDYLRNRLIGFAMGFHVLAYLPDGFYKAKLIPHFVSIILLSVTVGLVFYVAWVIYKEMGENEKKQEEARRKLSASAAGSGWDMAKQKLSNIDEKQEEH